MIRLPDIAIPDETQAILGEYQAAIDGAGDFAARVAAAKQQFPARNKAKNAAFKVVRAKLNEICGGAGRCCYCELSQPDEVEHVRPKDWFPELVFSWSNYTYSCGPCNGPKNNKFAIFKRGARTPTYLEKPADGSLQAPPAGSPVLIDPRTENPLDFMEIDLSGTFLFVATADEGTRDFERAKYTIEVLRLNERDVLWKARRSAFHSFRAILKEAVEMKLAGASDGEIAIKRTVVQQSPHPAVWQEIQRQRDAHPDLKRLFVALPDALLW